MANLQWIEVFKSGVPTIDREHREIVDCINAIIDASKRGDHLAAKAGCENLQRNLPTHLTSEEKILRKFGFPRAEAHARAHRDTMRQVKKLLATCGVVCEAGPPKECLEIWRSIILDHFIYGDVEFKSFLDSRQ